MKILEYIGYIRLPDDFKGDELDALEFYINYRRNAEINPLFHEAGDDAKSMSIYEYFGILYDKLIETGKVRSGIFQLKTYMGDKWETVDKL